MSLDPATHARLAAVAATMGSGSHVGFLSEVLNVLTTHRPGDEAGQHALRLLAAMWGTAYANRDEPRAALNDVGMWLERRLGERPAPTAERLAAEVVWLRRLARYQGSVWRGQARGREREERSRRVEMRSFARNIRP